MKDARDRINVAIAAVVATMDDCIREGIPCLANAMYLALESKGMPGMELLRILETAGIVKQQGPQHELVPGPKYEGVASKVREMLARSEVAKR